jgi:hypothetical protein
VQAVVTSYMCIPRLWELWPTLVAAESFDDTFEGLDWNLKFFMGAIGMDLIGVLVYNTGQGDDVGFVVHHVAILIVWSILLLKGFGHSFALVAMACEITQPFIGANWFMER